MTKKKEAATKKDSEKKLKKPAKSKKPVTRSKPRSKKLTKESKERVKRATSKKSPQQALQEKIESLNEDEKNLVLSELLNCRPTDFYDIKISPKYYEIVRRLSVGKSCNSVALYLMKADKDNFGHLQVDTIRKKLSNFRIHLIERAKLGSFPSNMYEMIADRLDQEGEHVLRDKERALSIQKSRLEHALMEEQDNLDDLKYRENVRAELRLFNLFTNEIIRTRQELGLDLNMGGFLRGNVHNQNNTLVQNLILKLDSGKTDRLTMLREVRDHLITAQQNEQKGEKAAG